MNNPNQNPQKNRTQSQNPNRGQNDQKNRTQPQEKQKQK